ncbi:Potassium channel [Knufia peltigerae]|uniref:Potassium channel n=1 Tax=Knufia peltigerae TaxID=1002370 RepID=A0AA38XZX9_9EURO|nr:Potassium channel [Knufia peltigerae]
MGYDHAQQKELHPPDTGSNSSSAGTASASDSALHKEGDGPRESNQSIVTEGDSEGREEEERKRSHRKHHHEVPKLRFRAADDDLPTDWWFASTAIPLLAATFAPMANMISIEALVVPWRNNVVDPDNPVLYQATSVGYPDPSWCIALNIASLVCGFVGNFFLLLNFTKRVRYIVALPATIVFFYIAAGILTGITVSMYLHCPPGHNQVYSQGFWNAVLAACLYMFNSMILMVNMAGYFLGHYPQHFTLTDEQRNLILQTMMFFIWLAGGGGVFARIEGWDYPDAVYFCDVTILTVGFGDFYPTNDLARGLVFPFSVGGIIILGLMVSSIHKFAGELSTLNVLRKHVENRRINTLSRVVTVEDNADEDSRRQDLEKEVEKDLNQGRKISISAPIPDPRIERDLDREAHGGIETSSTSRDNDQDQQTSGRQIEFEDPKVENLRQADGSEPHPRQFLNHDFHRGPIHATLRLLAKPVYGLARARSRNHKVLLMREEKDKFNAMRAIQEDAKKFKKWFALFVSMIAFGTLWCMGAVVFWQAEKRTQGLSYFEALYFCYVSLLTIGYGDLSPKSNAGKPFFVVWSLIAVPTMTILVSDMGDTVISSFKRGTFILGDMTVLPKKGLWHDLLKANPWLYNWMNKRVEKHRRKKGLPLWPAGQNLSPAASIEELATEDLTEADLTQRLAWAIRRAADDLQHAPHKRYSYEEWAEFTRLIRFTRNGLEQLQCDEETDGVVDWDWLEESSPMLSGQTESEWILDRLCESLLRLLKKNMMGFDTALGPSATNISTYSLSRQATREESADAANVRQDKGKVAEPTIPNERQERQRRASGADAVLAFFTGERQGEGKHETDVPQWSSRAKTKAKERRGSDSRKKRRGPFSRLEARVTGTVGGGRGGAGMRTLKMRHMSNNARSAE